MQFNFVKQIRNQEIDLVIKQLYQKKSSGSILLEIGAGGGWQAKKLSEAGYSVKAIDIDTSRYRNDRCFEVIDFDGKNIPFPDNHFDIIFSSNVLEHVKQPSDLSHEINRCLKKDGVQYHLVPSASWRVFTTLSYYPFVLKYIFQKLLPSRLQSSEVVVDEKRNWIWYQKILPTRHGETGNLLTETFWFSRWGWEKTFSNWGLVLNRTGTNKLFYTGSNLLGGLLSLKMRKYLSIILGSSCHIYQGKKLEK
jgi:2-polyprenyl-3-methyl-5-hydroxy-6-metoxy-1,4-benzoquinol methylase